MKKIENKYYNLKDLYALGLNVNFIEKIEPQKTYFNKDGVEIKLFSRSKIIDIINENPESILSGKKLYLNNLKTLTMEFALTIIFTLIMLYGLSFSSTNEIKSSLWDTLGTMISLSGFIGPLALFIMFLFSPLIFIYYIYQIIYNLFKYIFANKYYLTVD